MYSTAGDYARLVTCFAEAAVRSHSNGPAMALGKGQMGNVGWTNAEKRVKRVLIGPFAR
jgi:hypothetical protein